MATGTPSASEPIRQLKVLALGLLTGFLIMFVVLLVLSASWDPQDDDLATLGTWVATGTGIVGLGAAVWWRNTMVSKPVARGRLTTSWTIVVAIAEVGMLLGLVFAIISRTFTPFFAGGAVFVVSLLVLLSALGQIEIET